MVQSLKKMLNKTGTYTVECITVPSGSQSNGSKFEENVKQDRILHGGMYAVYVENVDGE